MMKLASDRNKKAALTIVTGILALFGLNQKFTPVQITKSRPQLDPDLLPLNGKLLSEAGNGNPDVVSEATPAPAPSNLPYGVEVTGASTQTRLEANAQARKEILSAAPNLDVLRAYSGTGGLGEDSESIDQYYTPATLGRLMWDLATYGLKLDEPKKPVRALEPSCGNGGLLSQAPEGILVTGVEMDPVAGRAAALLNPHAAVHIMPFESYTTRSSDSLYDIAVLNPPFGVRHETRDLHCKDEVRSERYFMKQTIGRVKHGGIIVALLPVSVLHGNTHQGWRSEILRQAMPLHAAIIPDGAFKAAGAKVTTCLLVLRRHDYGVASGLSVLSDTEVTEVLSRFPTDYLHRQLIEKFIQGSSLITSKEEGGVMTHTLTSAYRAINLGSKEAKITTGRFGQPAYSGSVSIDTPSILSQLKDAMNSLSVNLNITRETVYDAVGPEKAGEFQRASQDEELFPIKEGTYSTDRRYCFRLGQWEASDDFALPIIFQAAQIAQNLETYLFLQSKGRPEAGKRRALVESQYAAYRKAHGQVPTARLMRLTGQYPLFALLLAHIGEEGQLRLPEPKVTRLPIQGQTPEVIAGELADLMALTEDNLVEYAGISREQAREHLKAEYAFTGERWVEKGLYYSGHAFTRSAEAKAAAQNFTGYEHDALISQSQEFLRRVVHTPLADLQLSPRDAVIPIAALQAWVNHYLDTRKDDHDLLTVTRENGAVKISLRSGAGDQLIQARSSTNIERTRALEAFLNHRTHVDRIEGRKEMSETEYNAARTVAIEEARNYELEVNRHFQNWLPDSEYARITEEAYTWARGAMLRAQGSTRPLVITGYQGKTPHPYQLSDARSMAMTQGMINAYDVGLGKTIEMLLLIGYLKMCGHASRPIISVPAGLVSNWAVNARECYPDWNIVTVGMSVRRDKNGNIIYKKKADGSYMLKDGQRIEAWTKDSPAVKKAKIASLAGGHVDLIIMSRETLTSIGMFRETRQKLIMEDPQYLRNLEVENTTEERPRRGKHQELVRQLGAFGAMMSRVNIARHGDLAFEILGCDFLGHDEAHGLKNLTSAPTTFGETPKFLGGGGESQRAIDALHKGRFIRSQGGHTFAFTASWVKNSPMEVGSMLSMVTDKLPEYGLATNQALMDQYIKVEPEIITEMDGSVSVLPCVTGFRRLGELRQIIRNHVIARTYGDPEVITRSGELLSVPEAEIEEVMIDMSQEQADAYVGLRARARAADATAKGELHPFSILWDMRKLTIDPALMNVGGPNPRFEKIAELALENRREGGKGIVFLTTGEKQGSFARLKETLVAAGYPAKEIAIVSSNTHKTSVERQDLEDDYNYGDLTLILGTDVLGQGFNLQVGTTLIINADLPWTPEDIRQRVGRGARQGNTAKKLRNVFLLMRGSFDTISYTIVSGKQSWLTQLWNPNVDEIENTGKGFSGEEMALLMSDNPDETRSQIAAKRVELEELTGRAALQKTLETIAYACNARRSLMTNIERARGRKYGVTPNDMVRIRLNTAIYEERCALAQQTGHPLAKLVNYAGPISWFGLYPAHYGMRFTFEDHQYTITQIHEGTGVTATSEEGKSRTFTGYELSKGRNFLPCDDEKDYKNVQSLRIPTISAESGFKIHLIDARASENLVPKNPEQVISISVKGREVRLENADDSISLRHRLLSGCTVMHFLSQPSEDGNVTLKAAIVISGDDAVISRTHKLRTSPELHNHLVRMAAQALGATAEPVAVAA